MMTFVVCADLVLNATFLDWQRLGKQRVEALQILDALARARAQTTQQSPGPSKGWIAHPITQAWKGYENGLRYYLNCIITEWVRRGYTNNMPLQSVTSPVVLPWWISWDRLHFSHQAMLVRKLPSHYGPLFKSLDPIYFSHGYIWPALLPGPTAAPLADIAAPIPVALVEAVRCPALIKSTGRVCEILVKEPGHTHCKRHRPRVPSAVSTAAVTLTEQQLDLLF